jgi:hypothetical protein
LPFSNPEYYAARNPDCYGQLTRGSDPTQANFRPSRDQTTWVQKIKMYETPNSIKNNFSSPPLVKNMSAAKNPSGVQGSGYGQSPKVVYMNSSGKKSISQFYRSNIFFKLSKGEPNHDLIEIKIKDGISEMIKVNKYDVSDPDFIEKTVEQIVQKHRKIFG